MKYKNLKRFGYGVVGSALTLSTANAAAPDWTPVTTAVTEQAGAATPVAIAIISALIVFGLIFKFGNRMR